MSWSYASTPEFFDKILDKCPRLYATFGIYHAELAGYDIREFLDKCPPQRVSMIEVRDFVKNEWCLPGKGKYRFDKLFLDLDKRRITAPVMLAVGSDSYTDFVQIRDGYEHLVSEYRGIMR